MNPTGLSIEANPEFHQPVSTKARETRWERIGGGALTIAVSIASLLLVVLAFIYFTLPAKPEKNTDFLPQGGGGGPRGAETQVQLRRIRAIMPTTEVQRVGVDNPLAAVHLPPQSEEMGQMSPLSAIGGSMASGGLGGSGLGEGFGNRNGNGPGYGGGKGQGKLFGPPPEALSQRCASAADRLARMKATGGTPACEDAVVKALRWLKANQQPDGSWNGQSKVAMTGLALLAYFGHCETPASKDFGQSCVDGIVYLVNVGMRNDGKLADNFASNHWVYEHAIATYALAEAATFCKLVGQQVPYLTEITRKAGQFIIHNQNQNGGWAYGYAMESGHTDVSIVGWQLQALKACSHTGIEFQGMAGSVRDGLKFIAGCQHENGGYGYTGPTSAATYFTLTGVGMLSHQMWGKGNSQGVKRAAKYVMDNTRFDYNGECCDLYGHYYESQAMMQLGGEDWKKYNSLFRDQLLANQNPDGSWKVPGGGAKPRAVAPTYQSDAVYRTCLATLMLEVYYRFLSTGGGGLGI
jgi:hypothetical protein